MTRHLLDQSRGPQVPQIDRVVLCCGREVSPVWGDGEGGDGVVVVAYEQADAGSALDVPEPTGAVGGAGGDVERVGVELDALRETSEPKATKMRQIGGSVSEKVW